MTISYRDKQFAEPPRVRVVITAVNIQTLTATGTSRGNDVNYIIDLTTSVGSTWVVPAVGEEWIITRAANAWALERRGSLQSRGAASMGSAPAGATVIENDLVVRGRVTPGVPNMVSGITTVSLASGSGTVTHGAPFTPSGVVVTPFLATIFVGVGVTAITATTFSIRTFKSFTNADYFAGAALTVYWVAFA